MLPIILAVIAAAILALLVAAATKPATFRIQRSVSIQAPQAKVFALINDFRRWEAWSPWEKIDPSLDRIHSGAPSGRGAVYHWKGNSKVGEGQMEITESAPPTRVVIKLDFIKPFEGHNVAEFTLERQGEGTLVRWAMHGPNAFISKLFQVFVSMEKMIGKDFDQGLANMKAAAES
jgi:uncharacterized protein YndB with AHSA1/START domain